MTNWRPWEIKPMKKGVYQRFDPSSNSYFYANFNGNSWGKPANTITGALANKDKPCSMQMFWRSINDKARATA